MIPSNIFKNKYIKKKYKQTFGILLMLYLVTYLTKDNTPITLVFLLLIFLIILVLDFNLYILLLIGFSLTYQTIAIYYQLSKLVALIPIVLAFLPILKIFDKKNIVTIHNINIRSIIINKYILLVILFFLSVIINQSDLFNTVVSLGWMFYGLALFSSIYYYKNIDHRLLDSIYYLLLVILFLQLPLQLFQYLDTPLHLGTYGDDIVGTFGPAGTGTMAVFLLGFGYVFLLRIIYFKKYLTSLLLIVSILFSVAISSIPFTIVGLFFFPVLYLFLDKNSFLLSKSMIVLFFSTLVLLSMLYFIVKANNEYYILNPASISFRLDDYFSLTHWYDYNTMIYGSNNLDGGIRVGRFLGLSISIDKLLNSDFINFLIGYGPGSTRGITSSVFSSLKGFSSSIMPQGNFFGLDKFLIESGFLSVFIFIIILYKIFKAAREIQLTHSYSIYNMYKNLIYLFILTIFIMTFQYEGGWFTTYQKGITFWVITALYFKSHNEFRARINNYNNETDQ